MTELDYLEKTAEKGQNNGKMGGLAEANNRIKNHIVRKGCQIRQLMGDEEIKPFGGLALKCMASILISLETVEKKMQQVKGEGVTSRV